MRLSAVVVTMVVPPRQMEKNIDNTINPATIYIVFSRGVPVRSKAAHPRQAPDLRSSALDRISECRGCRDALERP